VYTKYAYADTNNNSNQTYVIALLLSRTEATVYDDVAIDAAPLMSERTLGQVI